MVSDIISELNSYDIIFCAMKSEDLTNKVMETIKQLEKNDYKIIWFSLVKQKRNIALFIDKNNIKKEKLISITVNESLKETKKESNALILDSVTNFLEVSLLIDEAINKFLLNTKKEKIVLIFDNISTFTLYNDEKKISKFMHFILNKIHSKGIKAIIFDIKKGSHKSVVNKIKMFCDKTIEF